MLAPTNVFKLENIFLFGLNQIIITDSDGAYDMHHNQGSQKAYILNNTSSQLSSYSYHISWLPLLWLCSFDCKRLNI